MSLSPLSPQGAAEFVRARIPSAGLFAGMEWRISPAPFRIDKKLAAELEKLGRVLLQFNRAVNQLYRKSSAGQVPEWAAAYLDQGKPEQIIQWQRTTTFKNDLPRVIRPDILLTDEGLKVSELDSVPGGIGLTGWLNKTYSELREQGQEFGEVLGGASGMQKGFASIFPPENRVNIVISKESETYAPEMEWLANEVDPNRFFVRDGHYRDFGKGESVYRFFELFDVPNVKNAFEIFARAERQELFVTAPPKACLEEKMLFALLWNRNLREFWRQQLGEGFLKRMQELAPYSWILDPTPLPPYGAIPQLELTDWSQLMALSQKERALILKLSGFSENAWGSRSVYLGSDMSHSEWAQAVQTALNSFPKNPFILQRYHKPSPVEIDWFDFETGKLEKMEGRVRLCPYYFVSGEGDAARAHLGGVLATIVPADKKIVHGMRDAVLTPVAVG
ncbi:MAG TPA: hypothetical protein VGR78_12270 [Verrucomicrobiae bacterium]|nr:hypothetical protein [Verrucomicrobiae bacterium]